MQLKENIPSKLLPYAVVSHSDGIKTKYLLPLILLDFNSNGSFIYLWEKTTKSAGTVKGKWNIENGQLILVLSKNHIQPYIKGAEFRYNITGIANDGIALKLKGTQYPPVTGIIKTSNNPLKDMEKIALAEAQAAVKKSAPKIASISNKKEKVPAPASTTQKIIQKENEKIKPNEKTHATEKDGRIKLKMSKNDTFTLKSPGDWDIDIMQYQPLKSAEVLITPKVGNDFNLILYFKGSETNLKPYATPEKIKESIINSTKDYLPYVNDNAISIKKLPFDKNGFYAILADKELINKKKIPRGKFKYLIKGIYKPSDKAVLEFIFMINQIGTEKYNNTMKHILSGDNK